MTFILVVLWLVSGVCGSFLCFKESSGAPSVRELFWACVFSVFGPLLLLVGLYRWADYAGILDKRLWK